ncbi:hypothetical protein RSAG8_10622, partial [Rhizoctonia solani AG-8 WAC10335]
MITKLEIAYGLLQRSTVPLFQQLVRLKELTLTPDLRGATSPSVEALWPAGVPVVWLEFCELDSLCIEAPPAYTRLLPLRANRVRYLELRGEVLMPDEDPADEESFLWPAFTPEDYCLAIKAMIKATPNAQTLRLNLSHFHEMFAHHLSMFSLLINIMVHTSEEHIDQELIDYATMRMPRCAWHWGMSEFVLL